MDHSANLRTPVARPGTSSDTPAAPRLAEDLYHQLVQSVTDYAIFALDSAGCVTSWNTGAERVKGYTEEEVLGKHISIFYPEEEVRAGKPERVLRQAQEDGHHAEEGWRVRKDGSRFWACATVSVLHDEEGNTLGFAKVTQDRSEQRKAQEQIERQLQRLAALRAIDMAITASLDLRVTLIVLLDQVATQLRVDAAAILLLSPYTQLLEYAAGRGFRGDAIQARSIRLGEGFAGRAAFERRMINAPNLALSATHFGRDRLLEKEECVAYYAVPLIAKGQVKGVLEVFHRAALEPDADWLNFLEALAGQAAIAVDNAVLFEDLQRSNLELALAYDTTLEGWSQALDMRDEVTEGHTRRVTEMTLRLARALGIADAELVHMRRGALLHDIGKMGIPDSILHKPAGLTEEEWEIMRKHPLYAYELLFPIQFLRPALDIPYCHHEKWDGSGYPRGLSGEEIPLAARIFAVVDIWDALRCDRPYRSAWAEERVREHIRSLAGTHLDPQVVDVFLSMEW
ncbi:hypothetical protein BH23GEM7_BH23GEM7_21790 [soil metagenome]